MKISLLILLMFGAAFAAPKAQQKSIQEATQSVKALIQPLIAGSGKKSHQKLPGKFTVEKCEKHKIDWMNVLTLREKASLKFTFHEGCDIEGTIYPAVFTPFPVELKLRNLDEFTLLKAQNKITSTIESKPVLLLEIMQGTLSGPKGDVKFEANYQARINPASKEKTLDENLGGELKISEIYKEKTTIKERIKVE